MSPAEFQWLRPVWLLGLIPLLFIVVYWFRKRAGYSAWQSTVDEHLRAYVIDGNSAISRRAPLGLFAGWALAVVLLAGPVWEKQDVPVFQAVQAEVILLDLSRSMLADDIAPDRMTRARFKLADLLAQSEGRQVGLIGFAERPYVISPITEDTGTIEAFLPSLTTGIVPVQGSRLDLAIARAVTLLEQTGVNQGHILYIGDQNVEERDIAAAVQARDSGHRLSVLAVGTSAGRPLRDDQGQFLKDDAGRIVVPSVDMPGMQALANNGAGVAVRLTAGQQDLDTLATVRNSIAVEAGNPEEASRENYWVEYSPWMLWVLLFAALCLFRRGVVA